jgi:AraC-like DNA-binding protein
MNAAETRVAAGRFEIERIVFPPLQSQFVDGAQIEIITRGLVVENDSIISPVGTVHYRPTGEARTVALPGSRAIRISLSWAVLQSFVHLVEGIEEHALLPAVFLGDLPERLERCFLSHSAAACLDADVIILEFISRMTQELRPRRMNARGADARRRRDEFRRWRRMMDCLHGLRDAARSIDEVARECGFTDEAQLTRTFRKTLGTTPAKYRAFMATSDH